MKRLLRAAALPLAALLRTERGKAGRGVKVKNKAFFLGHVVFLLAGKGKTAF